MNDRLSEWVTQFPFKGLLYPLILHELTVPSASYSAFSRCLGLQQSGNGLANKTWNDPLVTSAVADCISRYPDIREAIERIIIDLGKPEIGTGMYATQLVKIQPLGVGRAGLAQLQASLEEYGSYQVAFGVLDSTEHQIRGIVLNPIVDVYRDNVGVGNTTTDIILRFSQTLVSDYKPSRELNLASTVDSVSRLASGVHDFALECSDSESYADHKQAPRHDAEDIYSRIDYPIHLTAVDKSLLMFVLLHDLARNNPLN